MKCPECGRECIEESNYCFYCGHSFRTVSVEKESADTQTTKASETNKAATESSMKSWQWFLYFILLLIPYLWIVWIIVTFVWAFGDKGSAERKTMARGMLIALLVMIVAAIVMFLYLVNVYGLDGLIKELTNGAYSTFEEFMNAGGAI